MDHNTAQQHELRAVAVQNLLCGLTDDPRQFRGEDPFSALMRQCWREKYGRRDGINYMTVPF